MNKALGKVIEAAPDVINHNIEVVEPLYRTIRPEGGFDLSLGILNRVQSSGIIAKSGFMLGFGEKPGDIDSLLGKLAAAGCFVVTIGQYQQPSACHWPVEKYYTPAEFEDIRQMALGRGFTRVESGPLVRSSYKAAGGQIK